MPPAKAEAKEQNAGTLLGIQVMFDESFASSLVNSALVWNIFEEKESTQRGYHSSWSLFALSHPILIWWYATW